MIRRELGLARHIGIVAASPEGAALFYRQISRQASRLLPPHEHPAISIHNEPLALYIDAIRGDDWHTVGRLLRKSAEFLSRCGAAFAISPDNAVQHGIHLAEVGSPIPWLAMPDLVGTRIQADKRTKVGLIGTRMVTTGSTYQTLLGIRGIHVTAPDSREADLLDEIIFGELIYGTIRPESQRAVLGVIQNLARRGCEGVILGCSEAPLLVTPENAGLPIYDAADILAEEAVRHAMKPG